MADSGNLYLRGPEAKIISAANFILILESFIVARRGYDQSKPLARLFLWAQGGIALLAAYGLYKILRPTSVAPSILRFPLDFYTIFSPA
jgi:hypothetical protein